MTVPTVMIMGPVLLSFTDQFVHVVSINPDKVLFFNQNI